MIKTLFSSLALAVVAFSANALVAPRAAHADACSDLAAIVANPQGGTGGDAGAADVKARAQTMQGVLCPGGAAADAAAPAGTPAQLGDATGAAPSTCPPYSDPPLPAAGATRAQIRTATPAFNAWVTANNAAMTCHNTEINKAQRDVTVYNAAALVWQQHYIAQVMGLQAVFAQYQAAPAQTPQQQQQQQQHRSSSGLMGHD